LVDHHIHHTAADSLSTEGLEPNSKNAFQAKVLHQYKPQDKHELKLTPGDVITEVEKLDQGWCKVRRSVIISMLLFILVCVDTIHDNEAMHD